jgi:DNA-binding SARP family transcriptional activator
MAPLEIQLFGTLRVQRAGQPVLQFPTRRVKDLFSLVLLSRHTLHSREVLADTLWGDGEERDPRHCLNTALWRLRRVLGEPDAGEHPYLRVDAQHIGFNTASECRIDVAEFESRCLWAEQLGTSAPDQQAAFLQQAVDFYRADLLVDCYEDWCLAERERLQRMYLRALETLVKYHAARGEFAQATEHATKLLACDPLREDVHRQMISLYLDTQQPAMALRQYHACETVLQRELGTTPTAETTAMVRPIFAPAAEATRVKTLPAKIETGPTVPGDLAAVIERLRQAMEVVESARADLGAALTSMEGLTKRFPETGSALPDQPVKGAVAVGPERWAGAGVASHRLQIA